MLLILLVVPAFLFLFFKFFGSNHYDLPYFHPLVDSTTGKVVLKDTDTVYYRVEGSLGRDAEGKPVNAAELDGKITLICIRDSVGATAEWKEGVKRLAEAFGNEKLVKGLIWTPQGNADAIFSGELNSLDGAAHFWRGITSGAGEKGEGPGRLLKRHESPAGGRTFPKENELVLVDTGRYIRGYYKISEEEDLDRAKGEIKILLYQKQQL